MISARIAAAGALVLALVGSHWWAYRHGDSAGADRVQSLWGLERARLVAAAEEARALREQQENDAAKRLQEQRDEYTKELERQRGATADVRRELGRLLDAIATDAANRGQQPAAASPGPPANGKGSITGELFEACARDFTRMGEEAGKLAALVVGLQGYAEEARRTCGK